jgi:hypothetical protein
MTISTFDEWIASSKQLIPYSKSARTTVANGWFTVHDLDGNPGKASALAVGNTANGAVPTDATSGYPSITFSTGTGYLSSVMFGNTVGCRMTVYDRLFHSGAHNFNAADTLTSQPSYGGRVPSANYAGLELWVECVTAFTGTPSVAITYTNQAGTTGKTTGTVSMGAALTVGRMVQVPLASGDSGLQKVESVTATVASAGTFNVVVLRPLWSGRVAFANSGDVHGMDRTGMPQVFGDSALALMVNADSTSSGGPDLALVIVSA